MRIEVVYSPAARVVDAVVLDLPDGTSANAALAASGIVQRHASLDLAAAALGVWGRKVPHDHALRDGDRLEVYRGLLVDPKEARRMRYRAQGQKGRAPRVRRAPESDRPVDGST